jgi:hypothetical protein
MSLSRAALFKKCANKNHEYERYLVTSEPTPNATVDLDSTRTYVITLPLSYFVSTTSRARHKGKADSMPYESFRIMNMQHRGGNAHSLVLIKSRAIKTNPHNISIFESNGRNGFCGIRIVDDRHCNVNVTKAYTSISPEFNINYGSDTNNPGYCGIYGIICIVAFRHYRSKTGAMWLAKWKKLLMYMSRCIDRNAGCLGVELAARVQEIIATTPVHGCAEREIIAEIRSCIAQREIYCQPAANIIQC